MRTRETVVFGYLYCHYVWYFTGFRGQKCIFQPSPFLCQIP